ncbi:MAG: SRPBCC family protein [Pseudomonadota bacterium]
MQTGEDKIEKVIEFNAPVARVWRALTDAEEFGQWFRVELDGPFEEGRRSTGKMTYPGYEHYPWVATVERMEHEKLFSFRWHDFDEKSSVDVLQQPTTLVEFRLEATPDGTRLTITESGFASIANPRRLEVLRDNTEGWNIQAQSLYAYVSASR